MEFDETLDATGLLCPEPLLLVRNAVRKLAGGSVLRIIATDPTTERDFRHFCQFMGHTLMNSERQTDAAGELMFFYCIRKREA